MLERALDCEFQACCHTLSSLSTAFAELAMVADETPSLAATEEALQQIEAAAVELQEAFAFIDLLEQKVQEAAMLVEATDRRLSVIERGEQLPESIAHLPPAQFSMHLFMRQLRRKEHGGHLELPELSALPPVESTFGDHQRTAERASDIDDRDRSNFDRFARAATGDVRKAASNVAATAADQARTAAISAANGARTFYKRLQDEGWLSGFQAR